MSMMIKLENNTLTQHTMKTIKQWFESVKDEKLRKELLENMDEIYQDIKYDSFTDAMRAAFYWEKTQQGSEYWLTVIEQALNNEIETL